MIKKNKEYIAVVAPRRGMGDCISFYGIFKTIYKVSGNKLILITHKNTSAKDIYSGNKIFKKIIYLKERNRSFFYFFKEYIDLIKIFNLLKFYHVNKLLVLHKSFKYIITAKISGLSSIEAIGEKYQKFFLNNGNRVYKNFFEKILHPRDSSVRLIKNIYNLKNIEDNYFIPNNPKSFNNRKYIAIGLACSGYARFWGKNNFIRVINFLIKKNFYNFLFLSGKDQSYLENEIIKNFNKKNLHFIKTSQLSLSKIIYYLKNVKFYFGNDTGFSHLTVSYRIPSLILHGDAPKHDYSNFIYPIINKDRVISKNAIFKIKYSDAKKNINFLLKKYQTKKIINEVK
jgi:heptosyltransferase-2